MAARKHIAAFGGISLCRRLVILLGCSFSPPQYLAFVQGLARLEGIYAQAGQCIILSPSAACPLLECSPDSKPLAAPRAGTRRFPPLRVTGAREQSPLLAPLERERTAADILRADRSGPRRKSRHSREGGNPPSSGLTWISACAGVTTPAIFIPLAGPQAQGHSQ